MAKQLVLELNCETNADLRLRRGRGARVYPVLGDRPDYEKLGAMAELAR